MSEVILNLDKPRTLRYRNKAIKKIEGIFKCKISKLDLTVLGVDDILNLIHVGLVHEDPELKLKDVEDLLDEYMEFGEVIEKMTEAFNSAFGVKNKKNEQPLQLETATY